jgi:hypothetical protein
MSEHDYRKLDQEFFTEYDRRIASRERLSELHRLRLSIERLRSYSCIYGISQNLRDDIRDVCDAAEIGAARTKEPQ